MSKYSTFLFANPSFAEGMARVLDMGGTLNVYNASSTERQADYLALLADWLAVGEDLLRAELALRSRLLEGGESGDKAAGRQVCTVG